MVLLSLCARAARQVLYITLGVSAASYAFVYAALVGAAPGLGLLRGQPWRKLQTIASMAATLAIARSPASMVPSASCRAVPGACVLRVMACLLWKGIPRAFLGQDARNSGLQLWARGALNCTLTCKRRARRSPC